MKPSNKKSYINISHLIQQYQGNKQPLQKNQQGGFKVGRPHSERRNYEGKDMASKENQNHLNLTRKNSLKLDTKEVSQPEPFLSAAQHKRQEVSKKLFIQEECGKASTVAYDNQLKFKQLQNLIVSDKMFIDPDKWEQYLHQSKTDQKFHRALSAFLYSYFIQNYQ